MPTSYNRIAGRSVERLAALSDGVFAVAMTLLVLDLRLPTVESVHVEHDLWRALVSLAPRLLMYAMSFVTLGIFWIGQQTQLNHLAGAHRSLAWIHMIFLFSVSIMPFSTMLLAQFPLYFSWNCATELGLVKDDMASDVPSAIQRRILLAQALYALGALLCIFSTYWSIAFIVLVQLNYAIAPKIWGHSSSEAL